jgi:dTDP-4-amino-4,6-dideoxygalactose transaminase
MRRGVFVGLVIFMMITMEFMPVLSVALHVRGRAERSLTRSAEEMHIPINPLANDSYIDPDNFNIDLTHIESAITEKTKAIMPVHLFGQCVDMDPLLEIARKHKVKVIEDAAQALSARYKDRMAGVMGDFGCFSFYPSKNLGAAGDGGIVVTNTEENDTALRKLKAHGGLSEYHHDLVGFNSRLDTLQAAILLVKLDYLDDWSSGRIGNAAFYTRAFEESKVKTPKIEEFAYHIFNQYTILVENRDALKEHLLQNSIGCKIYYPLPLHLQECFKHLGYQEGDFPVAERTAKQALSIPIFPQLTREEQEVVVDRITKFLD